MQPLLHAQEKEPAGRHLNQKSMFRQVYALNHRTVLGQSDHHNPFTCDSDARLKLKLMQQSFLVSPVSRFLFLIMMQNHQAYSALMSKYE